MSDRYQPKVNRRTTLKWMASVMGASLMTYGCTPAVTPTSRRADLGVAKAISGGGYGQDASMIHPLVPWSKTMSKAQMQITARVCDLILPRDEHSPAASDVGVPDFIDEWVSAPYPQQQQDREIVLEGLLWLEQQALDQFQRSFVDLDRGEAASILDTIAYADKVAHRLQPQTRFFARLRWLALGAFYTTEEGIRDLNFVGNQPIAGDYPGASPEALDHINQVLTGMGLPQQQV
ncbi:gluconate 2-dehydrogenase subunit 3 family protein [Pseudomaricurvus alkylphenolicus]|jgi:hypothetical protein|uniref:gluconate 2-dehydrogenase subunit 3 family protein n=1 Tax=Pseudomaricurvus alkylphenolicus TaxID=1306991 RepID=UPI0014225FAC|nr:gluconate 2-dehydrogenase subunit 3 family protein [Pseudomaricurvus alkylphenolicus]NIB38217.1 gluconate 2-dehydrogenase subunit 3 family protein [Pseudomaricurvus alkylphenolicus]